MRLSSITILVATFLLAAVTSVIAATFAATAVETSSADGVRIALEDESMGWVDVESDGLQVELTGTAPSEADRFKAITVAAQVVDSSRVIDHMTILDSEGLAPPRFSIEILRNDGHLSLIGLIPASTNRDALVTRLDDLPGVTEIANLLETADYRVPENWPLSLEYAIAALRDLPRSKISVAAGEVTITAMTESVEKRRQLESRLRRQAAGPITLNLQISAPRPVIAPFTLRYIVDDAGARFDACSADTEEARELIVTAAKGAGLNDEARCTLGLGVPSPEWAEAASSAILALGRIGKGSVTFSDADVSLIAAEGTDRATFDRIIGELDNDLPEVFALHAVLPEVEDGAAKGPAEFVATLSPEGQVQLRGRIRDELSRKTADSYAKSRFGSEKVYVAARLDDTLPEAWSLRVLAGLQAMSELAHGLVTVTPDSVSVSGDTGNKDASATIARILSERLGEGQDFTIEVAYQEKLDPNADRPAPEKCINDVKAIQVKNKINFEPGSATVTSDSRPVIDTLAELLRFCGPLRIEIGGHTDSQGREEMNLDLSQKRADTVLTELRMRRVVTAGFTATGYGESQPIADNGNEDGREANRRIEFSLIAVATDENDQSGLESTTESGAEETDDDAAAKE
ncbi:MAG: hypothetical protein CML03_04190 [Pseudooceanicola sp.]|nr:hypothetical protein [Pseudooceanicola sp.]|tara:strand:- start:784 stop:2679 length:1896 start_codon:yes stop_codon:yes gene_type:complete